MKQELIEMFDRLTEAEQIEVLQFAEDLINDNVDDNPKYTEFLEYEKKINRL